MAKAKEQNMAGIKELEQQAIAARRAASNAANPPAFQAKEPGEARAAEWLKDQAQNAISREASKFLQKNGFLASGRKRGKKIPGL